MRPILISEGYKYKKMGKVNERVGLRAKILIVEDDESQRFLYSEELREEGYEPITAKNGKEAIRMLKDFKPDLIILDIVMPVMNGMEALGRIIGLHRDVPIILFSSYPHYREDFMSWVADAYLTKSSDLSKLKETIKTLLKKKKEK
jgi:DNA-binding response OmpR family regulator